MNMNLLVITFPLFAFAGAIDDLGTAAPLSQEGYEQVAALRSDSEMKMFVRRALKQQGLKVLDEGQLNGFVPHYSGSLAQQDFQKLQDELRLVSWASRTARQSVAAGSQLRRGPVPVAEQSPMNQSGNKDTPEESQKAWRQTPQTGGMLPPVASVMNHAADSLQDFSSKAKAMQEMVKVQRSESRAVLAQQKEKYEKMLAQQKQATMRLEASIAQTMEDMEVMANKNADLEAQSERIRQGSEHMRQTITTLRDKAGIAAEFVNSSLNVTDDREHELNGVLQVLTTTTPPQSLAHFLELARKQAGLPAKDDKPPLPEGVSLLQLGSVPALDEDKPKSTNEMLTLGLAQTLTNLKEAEAKAQQHMQDKFQSLFGPGEDRIKELTARKEELSGTLEAATTRNAELLDAKKHLEAVRKMIRLRLQGFISFVNSLEAAFMDTVKMAEQEANHVL